MLRRPIDWVDGVWISPVAKGERELMARKRRKIGTPSTQKERGPGTTVPVRGEPVGGHQESVLVNSLSVEGHSTPTTELVTQDGIPKKGLDVHELSTVKAGIPDLSLLGSSISQNQHDEAGTEDNALLSTPKAEVASVLITPVSKESHSKLIQLPFERRSPLWKYVDLEVMPKLRQHPHFLPLEQSPEVEREGTAIGLMVTYENLMSSIDSLKMNTSCHKLNEILKSIIDLDEHGFEVQHLRTCLEKMARVKSDCDRLLQKKSALEGEVLEREKKRGQLYTEREATDKAVMALTQALDLFLRRKTSLSLQMEESETIIAKLQTDLRSTKKELASTESMFHGLLTVVR